MNILFLIGNYPNYGGTEVITTKLANAFRMKGHNVSIASFAQPVPELGSDLEDGITIHSLNFPVISIGNYRKLKEVIEQEKVDIILNQWCLPFYTNLLCRISMYGSEVNLVSVLHGNPSQNKRLLKLNKLLNESENLFKKVFYKNLVRALRVVTNINIRYVYRFSDKYVLLSESFISFVKKILSVNSPKKLIYIPNPLTIDNNEFNIKEKENHKTVIYVGRMDYLNKRVHRIIEAWEVLEKEFSDWELVLIGDGPEKEQLTNYVKTKNLTNVRFEGFKKDPPTDYYKKASIIMLTSDLEGFGLVILEGMSFGVVPIVYGSYSAIYDIVDHGVSGYISSTPYSRNKTVKYLRKLLENENQLKTMSRNAFQKANTFQPSLVVSEWEELIKEMKIYSIS